MKIAQICFRFGAPGGVENRVYHISKELVRRGHDVTVFTSDIYNEESWEKTKDERKEIDGIRVKRLKVYRNLLPALKSPIVPDLLTELVKSKMDIYHAHSHRYMHLPLTSLAHQVTDTPFVVTTHYHPPESTETKWKKFLLKLGDVFFKSQVYKYAGRVITQTDLEKNYLKRIVPSGKCVTVPAGISLNEWKDIPNGSVFREKYSIDTPFVLYAGRLSRNKGLKYLVKAASAVTKKYNVKFVFVGEDWGEKKGLCTFAKKLGIEDRIMFTGHIKDFDVYKSAFNGCEAFVLPSEWEAFGIVLAEAMFCKKPVIGTNVGGIPEVIDNRVNGFVVPYADSDALADSICKLLDSKALREKFGRHGKEKVMEKYTWKKIVDKLEDVYRLMIEENK